MQSAIITLLTLMASLITQIHAMPNPSPALIQEATLISTSVYDLVDKYTAYQQEQAQANDFKANQAYQATLPVVVPYSQQPFQFVSGPTATLAVDREGYYYVSKIDWQANRSATVITEPMNSKDPYAWRDVYITIQNTCSPYVRGSFQFNTAYSCDFVIQSDSGETLSTKVGFITGQQTIFPNQ